jgi:hypothetical protein
MIYDLRFTIYDFRDLRNSIKGLRGCRIPQIA